MPYFARYSSPTQSAAKMHAVGNHMHFSQPPKRSADKTRPRDLPATATTERCRILHPKKYSLEEIRLQNTLLEYQNAFLLPADNGIVSVRAIAEKNPTFIPYIAINLMFNGMPARMVLDKHFAKNFFGDYLAPEDLSDVPKPLKIAVCEAILDKTFEHLEKNHHWNVDIEAVVPYRRRNTFYDWHFETSINDAELGLGCIELTSAIADTLVSAMEASATPTLMTESDYWTDVETRARFIFDELELNTTEFSLLTRGDVLVTKLPEAGNKIPVTVDVYPNFKAQAFLTDTTLTLSSPPEINMQDYITDDAPVTSDDINELGIKLTFDVGNRTVSLAELKKFKPGFSMELDRLMDSPVRILANGKLFGRGQLIQVGKHIGVQITDIKNGSRTTQ